MPRSNTKSKQKAQSATASAPLPKSAAPPSGGAVAKAAPAVAAVKTIDELRAELAAAEKFAAWAATAKDDDAPALLFYPKPAGKGKGVWTWQAKAKYDAEQCAVALKAAEVAAAAAEAAEAARPVAEAEPCYEGPSEDPEETAARLARWAADGRDSSGVLVNQPAYAYAEPEQRWEPGLWLQRARPMTDAECQAAVDLFGWQLGADLILAANEGYSFEELYGEEMEQAWAAYCAAMRASEEARQVAAKAAIEANWRRAVVEQAMVEARRNLKRGETVEKNGRICTRCYGCVGNKHTNWEDGGHKARPSTLHVSDVCFTHQAFLDGKIREDCPFLHTGDAGWHAEWDTNFLWDPSTGAAPAARHVRSRDEVPLVCVSESSSGHLPVHLGGRPSASAAAGGFAERAAPEARWAPLAGGARPPPRQDVRGARPQGRPQGAGSWSASQGGGAGSAQGPWSRK